MKYGLESSGLWMELESRLHLEKEKVRMKEIIDMAIQKLDRINEVFPTYTLHDSRHSENVLNYMALFLEERISDLSDMELIILILSAYLHDVGMYYNSDEINQIENSDEFTAYLDEYPSEYLKYKNSVELRMEVINGYCRCYHAKRVWNFVFDLNAKNQGMKIKAIDILDKVAVVCESHNDNVRSILSNSALNIRLGYEADMKFCAILLRLADYVDFDGSRTPEYTYSFLDIENKDETCIEKWKMHLNSGGFHFGTENGNVLGYVAEPNEPYVEYTIRALLNEIEGELKECRDILLLCSDKWRNFKLPYGIDRNQIKSHGYHYGEYTFTLKKERILALFMGEQLYADKFVFIREIMQNAIDTSSYRKFWEESRGAENFSVPSIEIYDWVDDCANHYVRINDYGMGMSKKIIENYFLKVGESYYRSDDFNAEKLKIEDQGRQIGDFQPISQFGIGFLSCFLVCDSIEIYTCCRPIENTSSDIIRLSIKGVEDFYTMRLNNMADKLLNKPGYSERKENYGTSIVFHLNSEYDERFCLEELIKKYVFCPPISVVVNGENLDYMNEEFIRNNLLEEEERIEITEETNPECISSIKKWLDRETLPGLYLRKIPFDITKLALSPNLMGQGIFFYIEMDQPVKLNSGLFDRNYYFNQQYGTLMVSLSKIVDQNGFDKLEKKLKTLQNDLKMIIKQLQRDDYSMETVYWEQLVIQSQKLELMSNHVEQPFFNEKITPLCEFFSNMKERFIKKFKGKGRNEACIHLISEAINNTEKIKNDLLKLKERIQKAPEQTFQIQLDKNFQELRKHYNSSLSYNGIIIPNKQGRRNGFFKYQNNESFQFGIMLFVIVLRNDLRPQLNLARNYLYKMEWDVYSNINITIKKFFHKQGIYKTAEVFGKLNSRLTYKEVLEDKYIKNEWKEYKIIQTTKGMMSFYDVYLKLCEGKSVELRQIYRLYQKSKIDFFDVCSYTLVQLEFDILMKVSKYKEYYEGRCALILQPEENSRYNESFYAPLFFGDFESEGNQNILCFHNSPLNRRHPFSVWLLSITPELYREHRKYFNSIVKCFDELSFQNFREIAERLNNIIQQIGKRVPELKSSQNLVINYNYRMLY